MLLWMVFTNFTDDFFKLKKINYLDCKMLWLVSFCDDEVSWTAAGKEIMSVMGSFNQSNDF